MTILQTIGRISGDVENAARAAEFVLAVKSFMAAGGSLQEAALIAKESRAAPRVLDILKTAVSAGSLTGTTFGAPLAEPSGPVVAFLESLRSVGCFDRMLSDGALRQVPANTKIAVTTVGVSGAVVGEAQAKLLSDMSLSGKQVNEQKALAIVAVSNELLRAIGSAGNSYFGRELRSAVALATDQGFFNVLTSGISAIPTSGSTAFAVLQDLAAALSDMDTDASSRLYVLVESSTAKAWATKVAADGHPAFNNCTPMGGAICGMPILVADALSSGTIVVCDANAIAAAPGSLALDVATHASLQFQTAPDSPPSATTVLKSLWQENKSALKVERYFGASRLRDTAVAVISGVGYSGNSPN